MATGGVCAKRVVVKRRVVKIRTEASSRRMGADSTRVPPCHPERSEGPGRAVRATPSLAAPPAQVPPSRSGGQGDPPIYSAPDVRHQRYLRVFAVSASR